MPPAEIEAIREATAQLRRTLARKKVKPIVPPALAAIIVGMTGHWWRHRLRGFDVVYPGMTTIAGWAECSDRQAQRCVSTLRAAGVLRAIGNERGGRNLSTAYQVDASGLCGWLIARGVNPHPTLIERLRNTEELCALRADKVRHARGQTPTPIDSEKGRHGNEDLSVDSEAEKGDINHDTMSPRSIDPLRTLQIDALEDGGTAANCVPRSQKPAPGNSGRNFAEKRGGQSRPSRADPDVDQAPIGSAIGADPQPNLKKNNPVELATASDHGETQATSGPDATKAVSPAKEPPFLSTGTTAQPEAAPVQSDALQTWTDRQTEIARRLIEDWQADNIPADELWK